MLARYTAWLAVAHLLTAIEVTAVTVALSAHTTGPARTLMSEKNLVLAAALIGVSTLVVVASGVVILGPSLRWFAAGLQPDSAQRRSVAGIVRRQMAAPAATWMAMGVVALLVNAHAGFSASLLIISAVLFGAAATTSTGVLFTQRTFRPIMAAAYADFESRERVPGVLTRMASMWTVHSGLPALGIIAIVRLRSMGWIIERTHR